MSKCTTAQEALAETIGEQEALAAFGSSYM